MIDMDFGEWFGAEPKSKKKNGRANAWELDSARGQDYYRPKKAKQRKRKARTRYATRPRQSGYGAKELFSDAYRGTKKTYKNVQELREKKKAKGFIKSRTTQELKEMKTPKTSFGIRAREKELKRRGEKGLVRREQQSRAYKKYF